MISHYSFDYDYDVYRACENGADCCRYDFCRCGVIQNARILKLPSNILETYMDEFRPPLKEKSPKKYTVTKKQPWSDLEMYCLDRLFIINQMYDLNKYRVYATGGYYGEEIGGVNIEDSTFRADVNKMLNMPDNEKIRFVLNREYGYLLPELEKADFVIEEINYADILPPDDYRRTVGDCELRSAIIGVYKRLGDKYRIIDGHHRWKKAQTFPRIEVITY